MRSENMKKAKKTRFLTIILILENSDLWVDFGILPKAHYGPYACLIKLKTVGKGFSDLLNLSQTFAQRFMNSQTDFGETEISNISFCTTP